MGGILSLQQFSGTWDIFIKIYYASKSGLASKSPNFGNTLRPEKSMWAKILEFEKKFILKDNIININIKKK